MSQYYESNSPKGTVQEHDVIMKGRRLLDITGVKQVESFDNEEFLLETVMGFLAIKGENLQMKNLDVDKGIVSIKGKEYLTWFILMNIMGIKLKDSLASYFDDTQYSIYDHAGDDRHGNLFWRNSRCI